MTPLMSDLVLTMDDSIQQLRRLLPANMKRGFESMAVVSKEVDGMGLLLN